MTPTRTLTTISSNTDMSTRSVLCSKQECACAAPGIDRPLYHRAGVPLLYCSSMVAEQQLEELERKLAVYEEQQKVAQQA